MRRRVRKISGLTAPSAPSCRTAASPVMAPTRPFARPHFGLDRESDAYGPLPDDPELRAFVPGHPEKSEAYRRITTTDSEDVMPPAKSHLKLDATRKRIHSQVDRAGGQSGKSTGRSSSRCGRSCRQSKMRRGREMISIALCCARLKSAGLAPVARSRQGHAHSPGDRST